MNHEDITKKVLDEVEKRNPGKKLGIVWSCKTLQNSKFLVTVLGQKENDYIEATYNGDKNELYIDIYNHVKNECVKC